MVTRNRKVEGRENVSLKLVQCSHCSVVNNVPRRRHCVLRTRGSPEVCHHPVTLSRPAHLICLGFISEVPSLASLQVWIIVLCSLEVRN